VGAQEGMKKTVRIKDKLFRLLVPKKEIDQAVERVAREISLDYEGKEPLFLCILNGSFIFAADLLRKITVPCTVSFVKCSSYSGTRSTQYVRNLIGLNEDLVNRDVIIVEDIIDTGLTVSNLLKDIRKKDPASLRIAAFSFKKEAFMADFKIDYLCMEVPDRFIVGYGLDYDGFGRNLGEIYQLATE